ncbi:Calcium-transporting ATPase [Pleurostoma richardsiae]|uniref:Calcium-transporting ATPase n=1 Tax=Pleurostoma richardsiae TaxID=41990 RepID=A0AA38RBN6_9PEZI|nr:Calcium-transporting ATPase [Pleurostoma richardsiae]
MADKKDDTANTPTRRPRAPTITIDTTAVNATPSREMDPEGAPGRPGASDPVSPPDDGHSPSTTIDPLTHSWSSSQRAGGGTSFDGRPELATAPSFESRESRPTSPHNVSSPVTSRGNDKSQNFLAVPNLRQRQNSIDSTEGSRSITSSQGETVLGTASYQGDHSVKGGSDSEYEKIMNDPNALKPDQGKEEDFEVEDNPFAFTPGQLNKMFNPKSLSAFYKLGGLDGLEKGLRSDRKAGLSVDEVHLEGRVSFSDVTRHDSKKSPGDGTGSASSPAGGSHPQQTGPDQPFVDRKRVFKDNRLPEKKGKSLLQLMWITYNDKVLILLSVAAVVSLAIGLYQTFGTKHDAEHPAVDWVEGVAIIVAIVIVVVVGSLNDYQKERQFAKLNKKKQDRDVKVIRSGKTVEISVFDILVGDVVHLDPGDMIPVDGVLIQGFDVKCDESQATGESDIIRKRSADEVMAAIENHDDLRKMDPFIQSGARVMEGVGTFLVTSTGVYSSYGKTLMSLNDDPEITPLQSKLNVIAEYIAKLGGAAGLLLFLVLFIEFLARLPNQPKSVTPADKGQQFLNIFIVVVTIIVVAVPEGLPLAVTLALAFATTRMLRDNNLVRHLKACEVMGNATTICSDKTGTLTQNKMQIVAGTIGTSHRFGSTKHTDDSDQDPETPETPASPENGDISAAELVKMLSPETRELLLKSISLNSTAFEGEIDGRMTFIGSKTETALLIFAQEHLAMGPVSEERSNAKILQLIPFDSGRKCMGIVVQLPNGKARLYVKGASEIVLAKCTQIIRDPSKGIAPAPLTDENRETITGLIENYATQSLRTIGIIYRDFDRWPPLRARRADGERDEVVFEDIFKNMVFVGLVGIKDPLREGVREAVRQCQGAGVVVRMVTGDNKLTAKAIAEDCGILQPDSIVMEGPEFRNLHTSQQEELLPRLHVLARSSPEDKRILVGLLKNKGETVAVTGDGTNDAPALKLADVGFSMGIAGTEVAKEASAIILMDDNFASIVKALKWGRAVNDAVKRFLQFQLTVNVTAVVLTFVSAVSSSSESSVLTAVQLLWVNLIMDTLAALALATDPPQESVLKRKPERRGSSIISVTMWKMIIGQSIYQLAITFLIYFGAPGVLPAYDPVVHDSEIQTLVFNTFVWMQIFNQWNNRRLDNGFNIFEGLLQNWFFIGINLIMCGGQVLIVMVGGKPFNISDYGQTPAMWAYAIVLGFISIPVGMIIRLVPDSLVVKIVPECIRRRAHSKKSPGVMISDDDERFKDYPEPFADVRDELAFLKRLKGGRINNLKFAIAHPRETFIPKSRSPSHSREHSRSNSVKMPQTPTRENSFGSVGTPDSRKRSRSMRSRSNSALGATTVMAGIIAGSVGAGWSPIDRTGSEREFPRQSSPLVTRDDSGAQDASSGVAGAHVIHDEPQEMTEGSSSDVPRLSVPQPPAARKSLS